MTEFTLTKMRICQSPPNPSGHRLAASFDLLICGIRIGSCILVVKNDGELVAHGPSGKTGNGHKACAFIEDAELRKAIAERAAMIYKGITGALPEVA